MDRKTNTFTAGVEEKRKREKEKITIKDVKKKTEDVVDYLLFGWKTEPTDETAVKSSFVGHRTAREQMVGKC